MRIISIFSDPRTSSIVEADLPFWVAHAWWLAPFWATRVEKRVHRFTPIRPYSSKACQSLSACPNGGPSSQPHTLVVAVQLVTLVTMPRLDRPNCSSLSTNIPSPVRENTVDMGLDQATGIRLELRFVQVRAGIQIVVQSGWTSGYKCFRWTRCELLKASIKPNLLLFNCY